jgi:hypothetical protein
MRSFLKSILQLIQFLAQLGEQLLCWIGFLTCLLGSVEIGFHRPVFLVPATVLGSMRSMRAPTLLAEFAGLLELDFLGNLLLGFSTGPLGSCLILVRRFLAGLRMGFLRGTHALNSLERRLNRTHVHGSHPLFLQVVLILPLVRAHLENVTCQISLREQNIRRCHAGIVAWAVVLAGQPHNIGVELLYVLYKLTYINPLGLLEHVGKVVILLLSCNFFTVEQVKKHKFK